MRGIILSGGSGTRLRPLTKITSKQLLPIYNRPMIYYPLDTLIKAGIKEILIIVAPERAGDYLNLLGSGKEFGVKFTYEIQDKPEGLAQAFIIGEKFIQGEDVVMILGDNIFEDNFSEAISSFKGGAKIFAKYVSDPERFGVVKFDDNMKAEKIIEKIELFAAQKVTCCLLQILDPAEADLGYSGRVSFIDSENGSKTTIARVQDVREEYVNRLLAHRPSSP